MTEMWQDEADFEPKSKTQLKNEMHELQQLGVKLVDLGQGALDKIPMSPELNEAVMLARRINRKKEGFRRQLQLIGKIMRNTDVEPIREALAVLENKHQQLVRQHHQLEQLRDDIIAQGDEVIDQLMSEHPMLERQKLRQLSRQANKEKAANKPPKSSRELFQYLKSELDER
ncbi:ribosome biogenesis factor YjgA [Lacimicrobium sp. SS2-24]|uniref:ribosome biogenesis factor YjgA n=1 Tax=Lacimicrobium sp. SS2-24 TaxID=2005569 RepID=UPI000B4AF0EA|nr:ribosome biogenesis factor YjgA [Lacimicrobium sp. SS2-24]